MTKEAILAEALKLSPAEQHELVNRILAEIPVEDLTEDDIAIIEARVKYAEEHPDEIMSERLFWDNVRTAVGR